MENIRAIRGYELHERIGSGGFGVVYRAYQTTVGREVAIKIILPHFANHPDFIRRFEIEAQLVARLEHLHIVPLYDFWRDPEGAYLVMRWLRGGSLHSALEKGAYNVKAASLMLDQIASALALAHRGEIVHRDLKPANILLDEEGNAYLTDFGIAKEIHSPQSRHALPEISSGSPEYLSPEQARGDPVTPLSDIYSLGVVLYETLTGKHPFPNSTAVERMYKHINEPLPHIEALPPNFSDRVNAIIQKATAKNPNHRYADVMSMAAEFRQAVAPDLTLNADSVVEHLTLREHEILQLIIDGCSNGEIAERLVVTVGTVKWYVRQIYQKLHVRSRVQAIVRARELKLIGADRDGTAALVTPPSRAVGEVENPYKGLRAFQTADARDFFGRNEAVRRIIYRLSDDARFLAVVGPSGSGKSSLVKAGLIPALWRGEVPGSDRWYISGMAPGAHPLDELEITLIRIASDNASSLRGQLERDSRGLVRAAGLILPDDGSELVLIIDQLEEVFTLVTSEEARVQFLDLLYSAATDPRSRVRIVVTLRADFYDRPLQYPEFGELVRSRMETVLPLSVSELEEAVVKPAERMGITFELGLPATIIADCHYQPGALPLLQYALTELFEQRSDGLLTRSAYQALGGVVGALAKRADELYLEESPPAREAIHQMFLRLVTLGEDAGDTRRRVARSELLALAVSPDLMDEIVDTFVRFRLITLDHNPATRSPTVELAHEALLSEWARLRSWLDTSRDDIRKQRSLASDAADWLQSSRDASYLLRGARLEQYTGWTSSAPIALTEKERTFLEASLSQQTLDAQSEREQHEQELRLAHEAADAQRRASQRLRYLVLGLLVFLLVSIGLSVFAFGQRSEAEAARATSSTNLVLAQHSADQAQEVALVNGAEAALTQGDIETALALALTANRGMHPSGSAQRVLSEAAYRPGIVRSFAGQSAPAMSIAFSPDARTVLAGGLDGIAYLWDTASSTLLHQLQGHSDWIVDVGISPDGRKGFTLGRDRTIIYWDLESGQEIRRFGQDQFLSPEALSATFSPDGRYILSNNGAQPVSHPGEEALLILWDVATGQIVRTYRGHSNGIGAVAISPDGRRILSGGMMGEMILWNLEDETLLQRFSEGSSDWRKLPSDLAFDPTGNIAYAQGMDGVIVAWNLETFTPIFRVGSAYTGINWAWAQLAVSADGWTLAASIGGSSVRLWNAHTGEPVVTLMSAGLALAFNPVERQLMTGSFPEMALWDLSDGSEIRQFETTYPVHPAAGIAVSPDGNTLLAATSAGMGGGCDFVVFDTQIGAILHHMEMGVSEVDTSGCVLWATPVFSPDGHTVFTGVDERVIQWDLATGSRLHTFSGHHASVSSIAVSPDGRTILSGDINGQLILWERDTAQEIRHLWGSSGSISDILFAPDGVNALSTNSPLGSILVWNLLTGEIIRSFNGARGGVYSLDLSHDGNTLLASDETGHITFWDYATGQIVRSLFSSYGSGKAYFTLDGRGVFLDGTTLWELASGEVIRRYPAGIHVTLSPDGHSIFTVGGDDNTTIVQRQIDSLGQLVSWVITHRQVRELTCDERRLYQLESACDEDGVVPTRTTYPTALAGISLSPTPEITIEAMTITPTLTITPHPMLTAHLGENQGEVRVGEYQIWSYDGKAGEVLSIRVNAQHPANWSLLGETVTPEPGVLDTLVIVTAPDGRDLNVYNSGGGLVYEPPQSEDIETERNTDSLVEGLVLPEDGVYQIIVSGSGYRTGGSYMLTIESHTD